MRKTNPCKKPYKPFTNFWAAIQIGRSNNRENNGSRPSQTQQNSRWPTRRNQSRWFWSTHHRRPLWTKSRNHKYNSHDLNGNFGSEVRFRQFDSINFCLAQNISASSVSRQFMVEKNGNTQFWNAVFRQKISRIGSAASKCGATRVWQLSEIAIELKLVWNRHHAALVCDHYLFFDLSGFLTLIENSNESDLMLITLTWCF